ncbi:MAG: hypothetical protein ACK4YL_00575 [Microcystis sp.]|jgi:hypothetical protein|nr:MULTISPECIES: hypothetical protein [unclassified Microcystis]MCZ8055981.1 hypothetical protein [Microcystis sp. LE19-12.2C]MDJ0549959.1 hypothetical protein [Microcystis sp. M49637_WE12]MDJ0588187.1 hypothetical protein [Microcystis sp. M49636_WE2]
MYPNYTRRSIILSQELRAKLISCYPESQEKEEVLMKMISES